MNIVKAIEFYPPTESYETSFCIGINRVSDIRLMGDYVDIYYSDGRKKRFVGLPYAVDFDVCKEQF